MAQLAGSGWAVEEPGMHGIGFRDAGAFGQEFAAGSLADFSQSEPF
jgi:hypothetical protein